MTFLIFLYLVTLLGGLELFVKAVTNDKMFLKFLGSVAFVSALLALISAWTIILNN